MKKITFTVSDEEKSLLEGHAEGNLSTYCRETVLQRIKQDTQFRTILDNQSRTEEQLSEAIFLLKESERNGSGKENSGLPIELISCIFETLYMLRVLAKTEARGQAKSAIERMGLPYVYNETIQNLIEKLGR